MTVIYYTLPNFSVHFLTCFQWVSLSSSPCWLGEGQKCVVRENLSWQLAAVEKKISWGEEKHSNI